jgi:hypothetical protein
MVLSKQTSRRLGHYKTTGMLDNPECEPLYIAKIVQTPFRNFKRLLLEDTNTTHTKNPGMSLRTSASSLGAPWRT